MKNYIFLAAVLLFITSCKTTKISKFLDKQGNDGFTGVMIRDAKSGKTLFQKDSEKNFVPASNTKILSLYTSLKTLGDSIPAFKYFKQNDTLFVLGTGDPTLLHPDFPSSNALRLLQNAKAVIISDQNWNQNALGYGWAWDDYNDYYQPELSSIPVYGNVVRAKFVDNQFQLTPRLFMDSLSNKNDLGRNVIRDLKQNVFRANLNFARAASYNQEIPFLTDYNLSAKLLSNALNIPVQYKTFEISKPLQTVYGIKTDTVLIKMMQVSDNHLAEQLLILAGGTLSDTLSTSKSIQNLKPLLGMDSQSVWVDGSGLSRYNLFTPKFFVTILDRMKDEFGAEKVFSYMSVGGKAGTLRNKYKNGAKPYVFAKTGSMSGVYNESGFIWTKSGRLLTYSVMRNNFSGTVSENGKKTMDFMEYIRKKF